MAWYEDWFDSDAYELVYRQRGLDDARRLIDLIEQTAGPEPGSTILDVACGRGRHAILLAQRGYRVSGVDLAPNAIRTARQRAARSDVEIDFHVADMRDLPFDEEFDGVVNLFTSFGYFDDDDQHRLAIRQMAAALRPGGWLVQDFLNARHAVDNLVPEDERALEPATSGGPTLLRQRRWVHDGPDGRRLKKRIELCCTDHPAGEPDTFVFTESVRLLERADFEAMYADAGLRTEAIFGDYDGASHGPQSPRLILLARRQP
jgi:SAM-dependent methyltransferase